MRFLMSDLKAKTKKSKKKKKQYLIKWTGVDENGDPWKPTWEPAKNIEKENAEELQKFLAKREAEKRESTPSSETPKAKKIPVPKLPSAEKRMAEKENSSEPRPKKAKKGLSRVPIIKKEPKQEPTQEPRQGTK